MSKRIALLACALFAWAAPALAQPAKLSVAYVLAGDFVTVFSAKDDGFFDKHGLDVTLVKMPIATAIPAALVSGSLDIGMSTATIVLQGTAGGLDLVTLAGVSRFYGDKPKVSIVAANGTNIHTAQDLVGKRVGVPGLNSVMDVTLRAWLRMKGVPTDKITFLEANFPQMGDLLANHSLDAVNIIEPLRSKVLAAGQGVKVVDYFAELNPDALSAIWISTRVWADAHKDEITRFRAALSDAAAYLKANDAARKPLEVKYLGYPSPVEPSIGLNVSPADFDFYVRIMTEQGLLDHPIDTSRLVYP